MRIEKGCTVLEQHNPIRLCPSLNSAEPSEILTGNKFKTEQLNKRVLVLKALPYHL